MARLQRKFLLSELDPEVFNLSETIIPVTDIDVLLRRLKTPAAEYANLQTTAYVPFFTVPAGKRWQIIGYSKEGTVGSCQPAISADGGATTYKIGAGATAAEFREFNHLLTLDEGNSLGLIGGNNAGDTSRFMQVCYYEEDAF